MLICHYYLKMRVLLIGDPHFRKDNLDIISKVCQEILEIIDLKKPDLVISLGDTLDTHERLHMPALVDATKFYIEISKRSELVILIGNHDRQNNSDFLSPIHPFVGLESYPNITIVDTTIWDRKKNFIYVPYVPNGRFNEALSKVDYHPYQNGVVNVEGEHPLFIFAHQEFKDCVMGMKTSTNGDVWSNHLPQIFSGHIHGYQVLPKICYVGTFMQQNYGEDTDKALALIYLEDEIEPSVEGQIPRPKFMVDRIRLTSIPLKVTVHMNISELPNFTSKIPSGSLVKVVVHVDATETEGLKQNPHYLAMKNMVDKVVEKVESNRSSVAEQLVTQFKQKGSLDTKRNVFNIDEIVIAMLQDDPYTLNVFKTEIAI
ncbi:hypothetical protein BH23THE1_BH23THE1_32290 [soil metagenome]